MSTTPEVKVADLGDAGYAHRAVDDHLAAVAQLEILVDQAEMQTGIIHDRDT